MEYKYEHHKKSIEKYIETIKEQEEVLAVVLSGSLVKNWDKPSSDIDVYLVIENEAYKEIDKTMKFCITNHEVCTYEGGYIDAKLISEEFFRLAAVQGSEPTRSSFMGSHVVYCKKEELRTIAKQIPVFPEENYEQRMESFWAQVQVWSMYMYGQGTQKDNPFLATRAVNEMVLFAGRYILALNKVLFPGFKSLFNAVEKCDMKPDWYIDFSREILLEHNEEKVKQYFQKMKAFVTVGKCSFEKAISLFIKDSEWNWVNGVPSLEDI